MPSEMDKKYTGYILDGLQKGKKLYGLHFDALLNGEKVLWVTYLTPFEMEEKLFGGIHHHFVKVCFIELNFDFDFDMDFEI